MQKGVIRSLSVLFHLFLSYLWLKGPKCKTWQKPRTHKSKESKGYNPKSLGFSLLSEYLPSDFVLMLKFVADIIVQSGRKAAAGGRSDLMSENKEKKKRNHLNCQRKVRSIHEFNKQKSSESLSVEVSELVLKRPLTRSALVRSRNSSEARTNTVSHLASLWVRLRGQQPVTSMLKSLIWHLCCVTPFCRMHYSP